MQGKVELLLIFRINPNLHLGGGTQSLISPYDHMHQGTYWMFYTNFLAMLNWEIHVPYD